MCRCSDTLIQTLSQGEGNRKDIFDIRFFFLVGEGVGNYMNLYIQSGGYQVLDRI